MNEAAAAQQRDRSGAAGRRRALARIVAATLLVGVVLGAGVVRWFDVDGQNDAVNAAFNSWSKLVPSSVAALSGELEERTFPPSPASLRALLNGKTVAVPFNGTAVGVAIFEWTLGHGAGGPILAEGHHTFKIAPVAARVRMHLTRFGRMTLEAARRDRTRLPITARYEYQPEGYKAVYGERDAATYAPL